MSATSSPLCPSAHPRTRSQPGGEGSSCHPPLRELSGRGGPMGGMWGAGHVLPLQALTLPSSGTPRLSATGVPPATRPHGQLDSIPGVPSPLGMKPPTRGLGTGGQGSYHPLWCGQAGQGGRSSADTRSRERLADPLPKSALFPPHPCLFPLRGWGVAPVGTSELLFMGCCRPPDSRAELGVSQNGTQPFPRCREHLCFGRGTWPKGFGIGKSPPAPLGAGHPRLCHRW